MSNLEIESVVDGFSLKTPSIICKANKKKKKKRKGSRNKKKESKVGPRRGHIIKLKHEAN